MKDSSPDFGDLDFFELEGRFGIENARIIVRTLEKFEGISEKHVRNLSLADRLSIVMSTMRDSLPYQTRH